MLEQIDMQSLIPAMQPELWMYPFHSEDQKLVPAQRNEQQYAGTILPQAYVNDLASAMFKDIPQKIA